MPSPAQLTPLGKLFVLVLIGALAGGGFMLSRKAPDQSAAASSHAIPKEQVEINFAFGTEKQKWIEWAIAEFAKEPGGKMVTVKSQAIGSLEGARQSINEAKKMHLFSPGSSVVKDVLVTEWQTRFGKNPILREESLALTPMMFIAWKDRKEAFALKYPLMSFDTVAQALGEQTGWGGIANKPDWGFFKFGCPDPANSNGGLLTLALMAHGHFGKTKALANADIVDPAFQTWFNRTASNMTGLAGSSGTMMRD